MSNRTVSITVKLPWWLWRQLDVKSRISERPKVEIIREALERVLEEDGKPKQ